jgi:hypothetical protein
MKGTLVQPPWGHWHEIYKEQDGYRCMMCLDTGWAVYPGTTSLNPCSECRCENPIMPYTKFKRPMRLGLRNDKWMEQ